MLWKQYRSGAELNKQKDIIAKNNTQLRTEINNILKSNPFKKNFSYIIKYLPNYTYLSFKRTQRVSNDLHEIIIGLLLGDLSAEKPKNNCNTRLQFKQSFKNEKYIFHLYSLYKNFCGY